MRPCSCAASTSAFRSSGAAVAAFRREGQGAVIAPVARAGKFRDRHQLDGGDAQRGKPRQVARHAGKAAQQPDMQFVDNGFVPRPAAPLWIVATDRSADRQRCWRHEHRHLGRARPDRGRRCRPAACSDSGRRRRNPLPPRTSRRRLRRHRQRRPSVDRQPRLCSAPEPRGEIAFDSARRRFAPKGRRQLRVRHCAGFSSRAKTSTALRDSTSDFVVVDHLGLTRRVGRYRSARSPAGPGRPS